MTRPECPKARNSKLWCYFRHDRSAGTAVVFALMLPILIGFVGLGVETGYWYFKHRQVQTATDLAAYAGAVALRNGLTTSQATAVAETEAAENGFDPAIGVIIVNSPPATGANQHARAAEVVIDMPVERFLSRLFDRDPVMMRLRAVAAYDEPAAGCVLALDPTMSGALTFTGSADTSFSNCELMANSLADDAVEVVGSADVTASCVNAGGGVRVTADLTLTGCSGPRNHMPPAKDPYADVPTPPTGGPCLSVPGGGGKGKKKGGGGTTVLSPGKYCGGFDLNGGVTLQSGTYVISGGTFSINGNADVKGDGVTFYLTNGADTRFNGTAAMKFSAPTTGTYAGLLFFGDPNEPDQVIKFNGTADSTMTGALYFRSQTVEVQGNFSGVKGCTQIVARAVTFRGNPSFSTDCAGTGVSQIAVPGAVRLLE